MTSLGRQDADLHHEDGTHRSTPASTAGHVLEQHEARIRRHLEAHALAAEPGCEMGSEEEEELPDTCLDPISGHWFVVTYGRAPHKIDAVDCATCQDEA